MPGIRIGLITTVLVAAAVARIAMGWSPCAWPLRDWPPDSLAAWQAQWKGTQQIEDQIEVIQTLQRSFPEVRVKRFDPGAYVGVDAGPDGQPGIAGVDDGFNGIIDDPAELGATGSDDRLRVISQAAYQSDPHALPLVLERGGFVPVSLDELGSLKPATAVRVFIRGHSPCGPWELMLDDSSDPAGEPAARKLFTARRLQDNSRGEAQRHPPQPGEFLLFGGGRKTFLAIPARL